MHYKNFKTVVYIPAWIAFTMTPKKLESDYEFIEKYIGLDKVYLETHRDDIDVDRDKIMMIKSFLEDRGVIVSGGITTTVCDFEGAEQKKRRLFNTFCYFIVLLSHNEWIKYTRCRSKRINCRIDSYLSK